MRTKNLLVVGSGCQACREYALRAMASRYRLILADECQPTWQRKFADEHVTVPLVDGDAVAAAVRVHHRNRAIDGVVTYVEQYLEVTAQIAGALGLRHNSVATVQACRDKLLTRRLLAKADVPSAKSIPVTSLAEARTAADDIGYPVVVKPRTLAGSLGVTLVRGGEELEHAYALAAGSRLDGVDGPVELLVEQYLDGPQISVECVSSHGQTIAAVVTGHMVEFPPYFEQGGHIADTANSLADAAEPAIRVAHAALDAVGFTDGVSHIEMRLTASGPRIVEVNARLAGARIPYLWRLASGVDLALAAADVAVGATPDVSPKRQGAAAIRHLYPETAGRVSALLADPALRAYPWFHELTWEKAPGDHVKPPPNGIDHVLGFVIVTGSDARACRRHLRLARTGITVHIDQAA